MQAVVRLAHVLLAVEDQPAAHDGIPVPVLPEEERARDEVVEDPDLVGVGPVEMRHERLAQLAVMEEFVDTVKVLINALGYKVLEPLLQVGDNTLGAEELLDISIGSTSATGQVTAEGFVVLKGATVNEKTSAKSLSTGMKKLRDKIFAEGKVNGLVTTEDILFSSSSAAADFVLGYSASGPRTWKTQDGRSLKEIEDSATKD